MKGQFGWTVPAPPHLRNLAAALRMLLPPSGGIALECTDFDDDVRRELAPFASLSPPTIEPGTVWPRSKWLHMCATDAALSALGRLTIELPPPQVCNHMYAYDSQELLLEWHDAFNDPIKLHRNIPFDRALAFATTLGTRPPSRLLAE
jgi:hypothetical protein